MQAEMGPVVTGTEPAANLFATPVGRVQPPLDSSAAIAADSLQQQGPQHTLGAAIAQQGVGLHTGADVTVRILPASEHAGRYFVRTDLPGQPQIPGAIAAVDHTLLSTELAVGMGTDRATVRTVEHLLAALAGLGVDNARIELNGPEVPLLDGSAQGWCEAIASVGVIAQTAPRLSWALEQPLWLGDRDLFVAALPSSELRFTYGIDFEFAAIGNQWHSWSPSQADFAVEIAPARTFGLLPQLEYLRAQGLIQGGSLDNALVCGVDGWVNPPLRFANEPARHKLLDLVGDLSLLGNFPTAHFIAYKASHQLHTELARQLAHLSAAVS